MAITSWTLTSVLILVVFAGATPITRNRRTIVTGNKTAVPRRSTVRVVNGRNAGPGEHPWAVNFDLRARGTDGVLRVHHCGGALIRPDVVLTAAHCFSQSDGSFRQYESIAVHVGLLHRKNKQLNTEPYFTRTVSCVYRHEDYNPLDYTKDITLVKLSTPVNTNNLVLPTVATTFDRSRYYPVGHTSATANQRLELIGWGSIDAWAPGDSSASLTYPDVMQHGRIHLLPNRDCIKPVGPYDASDVTSKTLCGDSGDGVSDVDACVGDSGMPMFYRNSANEPIVAGIVSSGIGCAAHGYPGLYTKTSGFTDWIDQGCTALATCSGGGDFVPTPTATTVGATRGNCRCAQEWAVSDQGCDDGNAVYNHCGMGPACDGDNLGEASVWSWCFLDLASKIDPNCVSPAGGNWDYCELGLGLCTVNQFASGGNCHDCYPGTTRPAGDNPQIESSTLAGHFVSTTCAVVLCPINHHVVNHACISCQAGTINPSGDFANGPDTTCELQICGEHQYMIFNGACWDCPPGYTGKTGDPNSCEAILCEVNQHVVNKVCVDCADGYHNLDRHSATGGDTQCSAPVAQPATYCPPGYTDSSKRWTQGLGRIVLVDHDLECSARCTQFSGSQYSGGCKGYMTGIYYGMLLCRSYGGTQQSTDCAQWANPNSGGACCTAITTSP